MRLAVVTIGILGMMVLGCKKGEQKIENGSTNESAETSKAVSKDPEATSVDAADEHMKALLLALQRVHFGFDTDTLTDAGKQALSEAAEKLTLLPEVALYVDGHTDDRGTTEYNMSLAERRAQAVVKYLKNLGIEAERLNIVSFGEETPAASGHSDIDNAKNRRVEFRIMRGDIQFILEDGELVDDAGQPIHALSRAE